MKKTVFLMVAVCFLVFVISNSVFSKDARQTPKLAKISSVIEKNPVLKKNPLAYKDFIPLAVGNQWQYKLLVRYIADDKIPEQRRPCSIYGFQMFQVDPNPIIQTAITQQFAYASTQTEWQETYTITQKKDNHYFFSIETTSEEGFIRDGRYEKDPTIYGQYWHWQKQQESFYTGVNHVLTETIVRKQNRGDAGPNDFAYDNRELINQYFENDQPVNNKLILRSLSPAYSVYPYNHNYTVVIPAGEFKNCIEIVESYSTDHWGHTVSWENHIFFAPNVGRVYEYQQLVDGAITYELALTKYTVK